MIPATIIEAQRIAQRSQRCTLVYRIDGHLVASIWRQDAELVVAFNERGETL